MELSYLRAKGSSDGRLSPIPALEMRCVEHQSSAENAFAVEYPVTVLVPLSFEAL
jgi:hypothetical protein